jgi:aspartate kinase
LNDRNRSAARNTLVMKFGGAALGTTSALSQVIGIILHEYSIRERLVLVVSALEGVTDSLMEATQHAQLSNRRGYRRIAANVRTRHLNMVEKMPLNPTERSALQADIDRLLYDMLNICQAIADDTSSPDVPPEAIDAVVGTGEKLAARVVAALLRQNNIRGVAIDATDLIITDDVHGHASPNWEATQERIDSNLTPMLSRKIVPVITGYIASTIKGKQTTLGRGGSDFSASILGVCLKADEIWVWTDVDGIMSSDPREVPQAHVIPSLTYGEMEELAYFGARVLHSRMVGPLARNNIPLRVKNVYKPQNTGTLISAQASGDQAVKAITSIAGIGILNRQSGPISRIIEVVDEEMFQTIGSHAEVMILAQSYTETYVCFVVPLSAGPEAPRILRNKLENRLQAQSELMSWRVEPTLVLSAVGFQTYKTELAGQMLERLGDIVVKAISHGPSQNSLAIVIAPQDAERAFERLHPLTLTAH